MPDVDAGTVIVHAQLDTQQFRANFLDLSTRMEKFQRDTRAKTLEMNDAFRRVHETIRGLGAVVGLGELSREIITITANAQQAEVVMTHFLGSTTAAQSLAAGLRDIGVATGQSVPGLDMMARQMTALGTSQAGIRGLAHAIGEMSAAVPTWGQAFQGFAQTVMAMPEVSGRAFQQLARQGVPVYQWYAQQKGITPEETQMLSRRPGGLPERGEALINTLVAGSEKNLDFIAEKLSDNTLGGQIRKLGQQFEELGLKLGNAMLPVLTKIVTAIQSMVGWVGKLSSSTMASVAETALAFPVYRLGQHYYGAAKAHFQTYRAAQGAGYQQQFDEWMDDQRRAKLAQQHGHLDVFDDEIGSTHGLRLEDIPRYHGVQEGGYTTPTGELIHDGSAHFYPLSSRERSYQGQYGLAPSAFTGVEREFQHATGAVQDDWGRFKNAIRSVGPALTETFTGATARCREFGAACRMSGSILGTLRLSGAVIGPVLAGAFNAAAFSVKALAVAIGSLAVEFAPLLAFFAFMNGIHFTAFGHKVDIAGYNDTQEAEQQAKDAQAQEAEFTQRVAQRKKGIAEATASAKEFGMTYAQALAAGQKIGLSSTDAVDQWKIALEYIAKLTAAKKEMAQFGGWIQIGDISAVKDTIKFLESHVRDLQQTLGNTAPTDPKYQQLQGDVSLYSGRLAVLKGIYDELAASTVRAADRQRDYAKSLLGLAGTHGIDRAQLDTVRARLTGAYEPRERIDVQTQLAQQQLTVNSYARELHLLDTNNNALAAASQELKAHTILQAEYDERVKTINADYDLGITKLRQRTQLEQEHLTTAGVTAQQAQRLREMDQNAGLAQLRARLDAQRQSSDLVDQEYDTRQAIHRLGSMTGLNTGERARQQTALAYDQQTAAAHDSALVDQGQAELRWAYLLAHAKTDYARQSLQYQHDAELQDINTTLNHRLHAIDAEKLARLQALDVAYRAETEHIDLTRVQQDTGTSGTRRAEDLSTTLNRFPQRAWGSILGGGYKEQVDALFQLQDAQKKYAREKADAERAAARQADDLTRAGAGPDALAKVWTDLTDKLDALKYDLANTGLDVQLKINESSWNLYKQRMTDIVSSPLFNKAMGHWFGLGMAVNERYTPKLSYPGAPTLSYPMAPTPYGAGNQPDKPATLVLKVDKGLIVDQVDGQMNIRIEQLAGALNYQ